MHGGIIMYLVGTVIEQSLKARGSLQPNASMPDSERNS